MPDGIVQLCLPVRWSRTSIGDITVVLRQVSVTDISAGSAPTTTDVLASQLYMFQTHLLVKCKVSKGAKIRNRYNQVPYLTQDTNGKVTNSQLDTTDIHAGGVQL